MIKMFKRFFSTEHIALAGGGKKTSAVPQALLDTTAAKRLFNREELPYDALYNQLVSDSTRPFSKETSRIKWHIKTYLKKVKGYNIAAMLPGTDPTVNDQLIVVSAHYDHLGVKNGIVYNGADDNGSGTVTILETARQLALLKKNRRPVVFVWFTGEEKGLLGSRYLTEHAPFIDKVMVNINMDMVGGASADSILILGSGRINKRFYDLVEKANAEGPGFVLDYSLDDENDPQRIYYRSDHWNFAKKGIPIVFFFDEYMEHYHQPSDDVQTINFKKLTRSVELTRAVALKAANVKHKIERGPSAENTPRH